MKFRSLPVPGAMEIDIAPSRDTRGFFGRIFCADEFRAEGLPVDFVQHSLSFSDRAGTLRGLHYQTGASAEGKLLRCLSGAAFDVTVDLRPGPHYGTWCAVELSAERRNAVFVPKGCAHGFQTLTDRTEMLYLIDARYDPAAEAGIRWDDPRLAIPWPLPDPILSDRDRMLPYFT